MLPRRSDVRTSAVLALQHANAARRDSLCLGIRTSAELRQPVGTASGMSIILIVTYILTPLSKVLLEKLTYSQLVKKFPAFYRTRRFLTTFTSVHHLSLS